VPSCSIRRESTTCTQRGSHDTATSLIAFGKSTITLVTTARSGSSQWQRLAIHCSAPPTYRTGVAIATRTGGAWTGAARPSGSGGEIVTTLPLARAPCRT
jgi:hypothetical protein